MRLMIGLLASLCVVELSPTLADEPPAPSTSASPQAAQQPATPANQPASSTTGVAPATQPPAASTTQAPAPAAAPSSSDKPAPTDAQQERAEKALLAKGYKPEMRKGQKYYCRREAELGSRFEHKVCGTAADLEAIEEEAQENARRSQQAASCTGPRCN